MKCSGLAKRKVLQALTALTMLGIVYQFRKSSSEPRLFRNLAHPILAAQRTDNVTADTDTRPLTSMPMSMKLPPLTPAGVPKLIHFVYRDESVIEPYRPALQSCLAKNPDWRVVLWTDEAIQAFLLKHFPTKMKVFAAFPHKIQRSDAIRYLILYKFGGLYMDLDMICHAAMLPSLAEYSCFLDSERRHQTQFVHNKPYSAMNSAMGCAPGHPFFLKIIEFVFHPDRTKAPFSFPFTIFETTGPAMLTSQYELWRRSPSGGQVVVLNETYFSPKINPRSGIYGTCRNMAPGLRNRLSGLSLRQRVCLELQQMGFENSDNLFVTNRTVAIHQFTHLGYHSQSAPTFNAHKEFPRLISYEQLEAGNFN